MKLGKNRLLKLATLLGVLVFILIPCGCRLAMPEEKIESKIHPSEDISATYNQVRIRVRAMVGPMCGEIEQTADHIMADTTNAAVRRAALLWKIEGVPAMRASLFQPNPFTALFDTWVFSFQMKDYFQTGPGKEALGEASPIAVAACERLEEEMNRVAAAITKSGDVRKARGVAQQWARAHPITYSLANRESTLSRVLEKEGVSSFATGEIVAHTATTVDDLNRRLEVYSDQLFRQGRWEAELFKCELMEELPVEEILPLAEQAVRTAEQAGTNFSRLIPSVERAVVVAENAPKIIATEREAFIKAIHNELTRSIEFIRAERVAAMEGIARERIEALKDLQVMMAAEHESLVMDMEQVSFKVVNHTMSQLQRLVFITLAVVILAAFLGLLLVRQMFFRRPIELRREEHPR